MRIGILGSGLMGGKLGTIFSRAGHEVIFSYSRSGEKLERLARDAGGSARAGTPGEAAEEAEALLLAVHWSRIDDVLGRAGDLSGKVILCCSLPMNDDDTELVLGHTTSGVGLPGNSRRDALFTQPGDVPGRRAPEETAVVPAELRGAQVSDLPARGGRVHRRGQHESPRLL